MGQADHKKQAKSGWSVADMRARLVRYAELEPCFNAFVDTRTPGSEAKENFTIIGPGVSENPEQHIHIVEPHGFNVGGARQPPGCVNSQHSHQTAELFVVHSGRWSFNFGETGQDARLVLEPGDVISIPTQVFRGFENVGEETGFLWAVLGGDDPGRVLWAPQVFEMARDYGLVLLESGRLIDTVRGQTAPPDERPMPPTTPAQVAALRRMTPADASRCVWRATAEAPARLRLVGERGRFDWPHGFSLDRLALAAGAVHAPDASRRAVVLFVHEGAARFVWAEGALDLSAGDTISAPPALVFKIEAGASGATLFAVRADEDA
jgi:mannose-6-phosphate isomerase-like protein (cupin superfamily)